jgi:hypothetical protein
MAETQTTGTFDKVHSPGILMHTHFTDYHTPINLFGLTCLDNMEAQHIFTVIQQIEQANIPVSSFAKTIMLIGGRNYAPIDINKPLVDQHNGQGLIINFLPETEQARQNFEKVKNNIYQVIAQERPDILR